MTYRTNQNYIYLPGKWKDPNSKIEIEISYSENNDYLTIAIIKDNSGNTVNEVLANDEIFDDLPDNLNFFTNSKITLILENQNSLKIKSKINNIDSTFKRIK